MVCFFSVLTHLLHEDGCRYLREAPGKMSRGRTHRFTAILARRDDEGGATSA
jgi:hypothetical protein